MRIAIDARIPHGEWGGVQQVVEGLVNGFQQIGGPDEYLFLVEKAQAAWLDELVGGNTRVVVVPAGFGRTGLRRLYDSMARRLPATAGLARTAASRLMTRDLPLANSDGYVEQLGVDLLHFATPQAYLTEVPSLYQPHDLLHRHFPAQFSPVHARYRDYAYRVFSKQGSVVAAMTQFGRDDLVNAYGLEPERVAVVPWAPVIGKDMESRGHSPTPSAVPNLPSRYLLYPAQTWPHKNHLLLLEALAALRDRRVTVPLVCTGRQTQHFEAIRDRIVRLRLAGQVWFTGYVDAAELAAIFARARALVFPSLFEGWGLPVVEAFAQGIPVACSNASALPEVASGAALLFDPGDIGAIGDAILRIWQDDELRDDLRRRGQARAGELSWERTARTFRAIYRRIARRDLSDDDRQLLKPPTFPPTAGASL
jgi:glycosyltransferase involved in cell wall biosynthesis